MADLLADLDNDSSSSRKVTRIKPEPYISKREISTIKRPAFRSDGLNHTLREVTTLSPDYADSIMDKEIAFEDEIENQVLPDVASISVNEEKENLDEFEGKQATDDLKVDLIEVKPEPHNIMETCQVSTIKPTIKLKKFEMPSFRPAPQSTPIASSVPISSDPKSILNEDGSLSLFLIDAVEMNGIVYLFGRVQQGDLFVSCCIAVQGIERNVYLLPRETILEQGRPSDVKVSQMDVYNEFDGIRKKFNIRRFASQFVERNYAFEIPEVPRTAQWMKVSYPFTDPMLPSDLKGSTFSHVFGSNTSAIELLVLKRKLMGPSWVQISEVALQTPSFSWSKIEGIVTNPKCIAVLAQQPPPPPLTLMVLSLKSSMNNKNQQEILAIATQTYSVDIGDNGTQRPIQQLVLVRPPRLGQSIQVSLKDVRVHPTEQSLMNQFIANLQVQDPDIILGHGVLGISIDLLISRLRHFNNAGWSKLGRLRRKHLPKSGVTRGIMNGRLVMDTFLAAKEFIASSKSYSLAFLAESQLKYKRPEFDITTMREYFESPRQLHSLLQYSLEDCFLVVALMNHLNCLILYKQLANTCGIVWSRTMVGGRSERNEYLLLHEFHRNKFIVPDKVGFARRPEKDVELDDELEGADNLAQPTPTGKDTSGGNKKRRKPQYSGGLVLDPKVGYYDSYVLLLDFNSLYPSIIQEFNICFTTVERVEGDAVPELPENASPGILPRLIKELVDRRRQVKCLMKTCTPAEHGQYNIRQLALKLTANSMYGCLGFTFSRFYCKQLAALITSQGRGILQNTVDLANGNDMHVIYGDTDSIMIHTGVHDLNVVKAMGRKLKELVNKRYRHLEIEMDGFFERMLLLKKKKYAALIVEEGKETLTRRLETKGLDIVRRDWCDLSHQASDFVLNQLLFGDKPKDQVIEDIHNYLRKISDDVRNNRAPLNLFVIHKGLTKHPREYEDNQQPHASVALAMEARGEAVHVGDVIPYVICVPANSDGKSSRNSSLVSRAHHPSELDRDNTLKLDLEWYLAQQILPPVGRLCSVIEGADMGQLAHCLGLDSKQFQSYSQGTGNDSSTVDGVQPLETLLTDEERFANVEKLELKCAGCKNSFQMIESYSWNGEQEYSSRCNFGWTCPSCQMTLSLASVSAQVVVLIRSHLMRYQNRWLICDELSCQSTSRSIRVYGNRCLNAPKCRGRMQFVYSPNQLYRQLMYYAHLFDAEKLQKRKGVPEEIQMFLRVHSEQYRRVYEDICPYLEANDRTQVDLASLFSYIRIKQ
jgi:DNA polymerase alpha subunit A